MEDWEKTFIKLNGGEPLKSEEDEILDTISNDNKIKKALLEEEDRDTEYFESWI
jgi:hypothetical protein